MASGEDMEEVALAMSKVSIEVEVKEEVGEEEKIDRHCAFCLTLVLREEIVFCGGCERRAYCSKECQKADWTETPKAPAFNGTINGYAQGHRNWCGVEYGEEDLDWKVVPIEGKGLGIVALRDMPHLYRIMVEGIQHPPQGNRCADPAGSSLPFHPAINDLHPPNADIVTKFIQNHFPIRVMRVGLRLSRINHSCRPNSAVVLTHPIQTLAVYVVFSERDIKAGDEICRSYMQGENFPFKGGAGAELHQVVLTYKTPEQCREVYSRIWGIVCPPSCPCRDEKNAKLLEELKKFGEYCKKNPLKKPALQKFQKIMENAKEFGIGPRESTYLNLFALDLAVTRRETLEETKKYLQTLKDLMTASFNPKFSEFNVEDFLTADISNHAKYLAANR